MKLAIPPALVLVALTLGEHAEAQTTWFVDDDNCPGAGSGTAADPFCGIQAGMDAAQEGDTVVVADGVYTGPLNRELTFAGKAFTLRSADGPDGCIIDCEALGRGFRFILEGPDSLVLGITVKNGNPQGVGAVGGGAYCTGGSAPTFIGCVFADCLLTAIHLEGASFPVFDHCTFSGNSGGYGGAVGVSELANVGLLGCTFTGNDAGLGGAVAWVPDDSAAPHAGSIVSDCTFVGNTTFNWGGALFVFRVDLSVLHCTFTDNSADWGGAIAVFGDGWSGMPQTLLDLSGSLLWNNTANHGHELAILTTKFGIATAGVRYSDLEGGREEVFVDVEWGSTLRWLEGNFDLDPFFVDPTNGDFHLRSASPCIDAGDPNLILMPGQTDIDGEPRSFAKTIVDVGSDEVHPFRSR